MLIFNLWFHAVFITTIIRLRKKDIGKIEKYSQKNAYIGIACNSIYECVCVCVDYICVFTVSSRICDR